MMGVEYTYKYNSTYYTVNCSLGLERVYCQSYPPREGPSCSLKMLTLGERDTAIVLFVMGGVGLKGPNTLTEAYCVLSPFNRVVGIGVST